MILSRRSLLAAAAVAPLAAHAGVLRAAEPDLSALSNITGDVKPIGLDERRARLARAQALMKANGIGAVLIEPGASLLYFTGVRWSRSERLTAAVIPIEGDPMIVTPFFEEPSVRESLGVPAQVRVWQEHESPFAVIAGWLREKKLHNHRIGIEETVRHFAVAGLAEAIGDARLIVSANSVVRGCRMIKTPAELALMQKAADVTMAAYRWTYPRVEAGMTPPDIAALMTAATRKLGGEVAFNLILLGEASAYPHGTGKPQRVVKDEVVLMDCGARVHGYESDISRTFVHGEPAAEQRKVWDEMRKGQDIAFATAKIGTPAGAVDDAVRRYYESLGYGPDYKLPGLSHRTGHGIGMDGHEPINLVRGETTKLAPGMCFSNEPGIYLPGKFGVRLEDCFHMTASGPKWFSVPPRSLEEPIG
ncbi:Xaa-Pro peptidase family protein [Sphingomonas sp. BT-65]|uniref:M24 family metallopeptidase n=1 Tax=Sphingomonas sp. BT-65 TaxID=2989821 RepID=UPI0022362B9D|nr:Xaa-Pro peptidase family protein [Sphingomonas sp. BT-65]MCW4460537.1 Xaa-Pro peptidase family protein [Sphingomonas sp. BT-65]